MVVWEGLTNSCEKKRSERQRRKVKIYPFECRVPKNSKGDKKAFLSDQCKEIKKKSAEATGLEKVSFHSKPKERLKYRTTVLTSHASKVMLKIL